jgi:hypothetical protein
MTTTLVDGEGTSALLKQYIDRPDRPRYHQTAILIPAPGGYKANVTFYDNEKVMHTELFKSHSRDYKEARKVLDEKIKRRLNQLLLIKH